ncbi:MAG: DUF58 domain-containing protein [Lapillicoccus sp.]
MSETATTQPTILPSWRPTAAHFRATLLGVVGAVVAVAMNRPDLLVLVTPWLVVTTWAWLRRPRERVTVASALGNHTLREGEATVLRATVTVPDGVDDVVVAVSPAVFMDQDPPLGIRVIGRGDGRPTVADPLTRRARASVVLRSTRWGARPVGPVKCGAWSTWGAYRSGPVDSETQRLVTLPLPAVFRPTVAMPHPEGLVGAYRSARSGGGSEFDRLRPFQVGDRLRRIHWPVSLRTGTLHVTSTYGDEDSQVVLVVDGTSDLGPREGLDGRPTSLDLTVRAAGAMAEHHLGVGDRVGLRIVGAARLAGVPVGSGRAHLRRVLGTLALIEPATYRNDDGEYAIAGIGAGAVVIVLSPLVDPAMVDVVARLGSRGLTTVVVDTMPEHLWRGENDPYTALAWRLRRLSRSVDVHRLTSAGIPVVPWRGPQSLDHVLRELARRARVPRMARR